MSIPQITEQMADEEWRVIPSFPDYVVSNYGSIIRIAGTHAVTGKPRKTKRNNRGYLMISLYFRGQDHTRLVHRLIMEAFVGPCPDGYNVDHINNRKEDNRLKNLRYVPCSTNKPKARYGEENCIMRISDKEVAEMRLMYRTGMFSQSELADRFQCSQASVSRICTGNGRVKGTMRKFEDEDWRNDNDPQN